MYTIELSGFDLNKTFKSGQSLRWRQIREDKYLVFHKDKSLVIEQNKNRLILSCTEQDFFDVWVSYFDLFYDYPRELMRLKVLSNDFKKFVNKAKGVHQINRDPFEALVTAKLMQEYDEVRVNLFKEEIAKICGKRRTQSKVDIGTFRWNEWPSPAEVYNKINKSKVLNPVFMSWLHETSELLMKEELDISKADRLSRLLAGDRKVFPKDESVIGLAIEEYETKDNFVKEVLSKADNKSLVYLCLNYFCLNKPERIKVENGFNIKY